MAFALAVKVRSDSAEPALFCALEAATASQQLAAAVECLAFDGRREGASWVHDSYIETQPVSGSTKKPRVHCDSPRSRTTP